MRRTVPVLLAVIAAGCSQLPSQSAGRITALRVTSTPVPTPAPQPTPDRLRADGGPGTSTAFPTYPPLDNPGGNLIWVPSKDAGPWPTDGRVEIPALRVAAPILRVGVGADNYMVTPRNARDVTWLDQGPLPGRTNNVVLAGHKNWNGRTGSFDGLGRLREGDRVVVTMAGQRFEFAITWVRLYDPKQAPAEKLMGMTDRPTVTLITCGGSFDRRVRHYQGRMIARAELVT